MNQLETVQEQETILDTKTILVAVDLSSHSERTVTYAVSIARQFGASLKLIHGRSAAYCRCIVLLPWRSEALKPPSFLDSLVPAKQPYPRTRSDYLFEMMNMCGVTPGSLILRAVVTPRRSI